MSSRLLAAAAALVLGFGAAWAIVPAASEEAPPVADEPFFAGAPGALPEPEARRLAQTEGFDRPAWPLGRAYDIQFATGFGCVFAVAEIDDDGGFFVGPACGVVAVEDRVFDYPWFGRLTSDLGGHYADTALAFYDWPLVDGKSWTTAWPDGDGGSFEATVTAVYEPQLAGPEGTEPGFVLVAYFDGEAFARWDYLPSLEWWSFFEYLGDSGFRFDVLAKTDGWSGAVYEARASMISVSGPMHTPLVVNVREGDDLLYVVVERAGSALGQIMLTGPDGTVVPRDMGSSGPFIVWSVEDPAPGQWTYSWAGLSTASVRTSLYSVDVVEYEVGA